MFPQSVEYELPQGKKPIYVRVRCPCCGMWTRLDNLHRDHELFEESSCYSFGRKRICHLKKINPSLRQFWILRLKSVLVRLGLTEKEVPYEYDPSKALIYSYEPLKELSYAYVKREEYPYET